jgi:hypothetical protein
MNIAIVSHDAGGAEIISSWALRQNAEFYLVVDGPAVEIFLRKLGSLQNLQLEIAIQQSDWVLCGSSWQSDLECRAISMCKSSGKKVVAFLDHWVNYRERFLFNKELILPDEIWVGDEIAESIAKSIFPSLPVVFIANPYFADLLEEINNTTNLEKEEGQIYVLYICEPIREHALLQHGDEFFWGYTEEDALKYFLNNLFFLKEQIYKIKIRAHPSEKKSKYYWAKEYSELIVFSDGNHSLIEEISEADIIVGCESMAMAIGLFANKRIISCIPIGGRECSLPQVGIEHLQAISSGNVKINNEI